MTYSPPAFGVPTPRVITPMADPSLIVTSLTTTTAGGSSAWGTNGLAHFYPVWIDQPRTFAKAWWTNGATAAGNVDVGIYTIAGATATRVVASTAEAQTGTSTLQVAAAFAATTIGPGLYYFAVSCSLSTATMFRANLLSAVVLKSGGIYQAAASHPLPATATVVTTAQSSFWLFGFSENAVI